MSRRSTAPTAALRRCRNCSSAQWMKLLATTGLWVRQRLAIHYRRRSQGRSLLIQAERVGSSHRGRKGVPGAGAGVEGRERFRADAITHRAVAVPGLEGVCLVETLCAGRVEAGLSAPSERQPCFQDKCFSLLTRRSCQMGPWGRSVAPARSCGMSTQKSS